MFEFEEISTGFHDVFLNKYSDSSGPIMDLYISDSMQDMLDIDIRSEVATVVGGANEFSTLLNYDLPSLDLDSNSNDGDISWLGGPKWSATSDIYADVGACVNPNSVMPVISSSSTSSLFSSPKTQLNLNTNLNQGANSQMSPKEKKSHLTFSPNTIKVPLVKENNKNGFSVGPRLDAIKKDLSNELKSDKLLKHQITATNGGITSKNLGSNSIELAVGIGGLTFSNNLAYTKLKQNGMKPISNGNIIVHKRERESSPHHLQQQQQQQLQHQTNNLHNYQSHITLNNHQQQQLQQQQQQQNSPKYYSKSIIVSNNKSNLSNGHLVAVSSAGQTKIKIKTTGQEFPKPAYSYSCLIAMALKNSRTGSLPVSEIYSFMCEHFPYFKTAPNGWKNSVRHNLSLNKCFEKIEKPATNGGQRKGCLWAMNPTKISKMDEEVQKWSRKDPMAIRKAMVYPEHLEALERGEMKHGHSGDSDVENEGHSESEEQSDSDVENGESELIDENVIGIGTPESCGEEDDNENDGDFDVEVTDFYDEIDIEDNKDFQLSLNQKDLIAFVDGAEIVRATAPKRARLDVNYSITTATPTITTTIPQQQHQNRRKMTLVNRIA